MSFNECNSCPFSKLCQIIFNKFYYVGMNWAINAFSPEMHILYNLFLQPMLQVGRQLSQYGNDRISSDII